MRFLSLEISFMSLLSFLLLGIRPRVATAVVCEEIPHLGCAMCPIPGQCPQKLDGKVLMNSGRSLTCQNVQDTALDGFLKCDFLQANYNIDDCECGPSTANTIIVPAPEPTPAPIEEQPPTNADMCFASSMLVDVRGKGPTMLSDVSIGDYVRVAGEKYERIYSFGHHQPKPENHDFLQISTNSASTDPLVLTSNHMVFIADNHAVPVSMLNVGDTLLMADTTTATISSIKQVTRKVGLMAPFTPSGTIAVNGVVASAFVGFDADSEYLLAWSYQWLAHAFEFPHRVVCHYLGACPNEAYNGNGVSLWVSRPNEWFQQYHELLASYPIVALMVLLPCIMVLSGFTILEKCLFSSWAISASLALLIAAFTARQGHEFKLSMRGKCKMT